MDASVGDNGTEHPRAWNRFRAASEVPRAAIEALRVFRALPDSESHVAESIRLRLQADPRYGRVSLESAAQVVLTHLDQEATRKFATLKESALVSVCGAFEYLVKAFFVCCALQDQPAAAVKLTTLKIRMDVADVLGLPVEEQWFVIADRAFEESARLHAGMSERVQRFLSEYVLLPEGKLGSDRIQSAFDAIDRKTFNEAFLVRNCIVHNGRRASSLLTRIGGHKIGEPISLENGYVTRLIGPIKEVAEELSPFWLVL